MRSLPVYKGIRNYYIRHERKDGFEILGSPWMRRLGFLNIRAKGFVKVRDIVKHFYIEGFDGVTYATKTYFYALCYQ